MEQMDPERVKRIAIAEMKLVEIQGDSNGISNGNTNGSSNGTSGTGNGGSSSGTGSSDGSDNSGTSNTPGVASDGTINSAQQMAVLQMEQVPVQMRDRLQETLQATLQEIRLLPQTEITVRVRPQMQ